MENEPEDKDIKTLKDAVNQHQDAAFEHQSEIIQYVHDVKHALNQLVEKVVLDQEETTKLCAETRDALDGHRENVAASAETEDALRLQISQFESERSALQSKVDLYRDKLEQAKSQLRQASEQSDAIQADESKRLEIENRLHEESLAHEAARSQIEKLNAQIESLTQDQAELETLREKLATSDVAMAEVEARVIAATQSNDELTEQLATTEAELEKAKSAADSVTQGRAELTAALEAAQREAEASRAELDDLRGRETGYQATIGRLEDEFERAQNVENELRQTLQNMTQQRAVVESEFQAYTDQIALLESTARSNEDSIAALKQELNDALDAKERVLQDMEELRAKAKSTLDSSDALEKRAEQAEAELDQLRPLKPQVRQLQDVNAALEIQVENVKRENDRLESEVAAEIARGTKSKLAEQLTDALREQELAQDSAKNLRREVDTLRAEIAALRSMRDVEPRIDVAFDDIAARQQLGELLLESGVITSDQLRNVLEEIEAHGAEGRIGKLFVDKGYTTEDVVAQALAHQMEIPFLRIEHNTVKHDAIRLISERLAEQHTCIPICLEDDKLVVAMENPMDLIAIEDVERTSERSVSPRIATTSDILSAIKVHYKSRRTAS